MKSQINLLHKEFIPKFEWICASHFMSLILIVILICSGAYGLVGYFHQQQELEVAAIKTQISQQQASIEDYTKMLTDRTSDPALKAELMQLTGQSNARESLLSHIRDLSALKQRSFSVMFDSLAQSSSSELWLTQFLVTPTTLNIEGGISKPRALPVWINELSKTDFFKGQEFSLATLDRQETGLIFKLNSERKDAATIAQAGESVMKQNPVLKESLLQKGTLAFDGLKKREQNLLFAIVPFTIIAVFFLLLIEPEMKKAASLDSSVSRLENQLANSRLSNTELMKQAQVDPNTNISIQIDSLRAQLKSLNQEFESELNQLVSPQAMPVLLEQLFTQAEDLSLKSMKSVEPQTLMAKAEGSAKNKNTQISIAPQQLIFRHGIEISFEGSFFATRKFLSQAEALGWKLYWQDLSYIVGEHPKAVTTMTIFTLSTSEAFIGVN